MSWNVFSQPLLALDAVVIDTETTGLDARKARVIQIGAVRLSRGQMVRDDQFERLINPGTRIPESAVAVHGITDAMVSSAPPFRDVVGELKAYIRDAVLIGHSVRYDLEILRREFDQAGLVWPEWRALDVRTLAELVAPRLADHGLDHLCDWLSIENQRRHSAMGDAAATAELFIALVPLLRVKNIRTVAEAEKASRAQAERAAVASGGLILGVEDAGRDEVAPLARIDSFPYRHRVGELMSAPPVVVQEDCTLADATAILLEKRISSVLVRLRTGEMGIVTERDVLRAIHSLGDNALSSPIGPFASTPLECVADTDFVYRAIGRIERLGIRHLCVRGAGDEVAGVVTTRNLLRHRAATAIMLGDEIASAQSTAALAAAWSKAAMMTHCLMQDQVDAGVICAVISSEIRSITGRAALLAEERLISEGAGKPPVGYAVLVLGSAGRGESQLAADQDNAIVYATGREGGEEDRYFARLGEVMCEVLDGAGIPFCKGGVMAKNRAWRMNQADWCATIDDWVRRQTPQDLLNVDIFFDAVCVHGDNRLADAIWNHAYDRGHAAVDFVKQLTEVARRHGRPFNLLGNLRLDSSGRIDLKKFGLMPIFTCARVLSIRHDVRLHSTPERLEGIAQRGVGSLETIQSITEAQSILLASVLKQQLADIQTGVPLSTRVVPTLFDKRQRARMKHALTLVEEAIDLVSEGRI